MQPKHNTSVPTLLSPQTVARLLRKPLHGIYPTHFSARFRSEVESGSYRMFPSIFTFAAASSYQTAKGAWQHGLLYKDMSIYACLDAETGQSRSQVTVPGLGHTTGHLVCSQRLSVREGVRGRQTELYRYLLPLR